MKWEGSKIREFAKDQKLSLQNLANKIGVSRQTVNDWINGQVPKGNHLLLLCKLLGVSPNVFFENDVKNHISVPAHRKRMNSKITRTTQEDAIIFSREYLNIFKDLKSTELVPVLRTEERSIVAAHKAANELRKMSGISVDKPIDYKHAFELLGMLGINVIFRYFPESIKSYAFYTRICEHRVIFVNSKTNIIDLIFPVLHESVHAVRDEFSFEGEYDDDEEQFCDLAAGFIQFPETYVKMVYETIKVLDKPFQVNTLKTFAKANSHSLYGIVEAIKLVDPEFSLNVGGADSNLRKKFPTVGEILFRSEDVSHYVRIMKTLSKNFLSILLSQLDNISTRKLGEILGIDSILDAKEVRNELQKELTLLSD